MTAVALIKCHSMHLGSTASDHQRKKKFIPGEEPSQNSKNDYAWYGLM
jgi:hypothetical protein